MKAKRHHHTAAARAATAEVLLESLPSVMGFVSSRLRRNAGVDNPVHFRLLRTLRRGPRSLHELAELHEVKLPTMSRTVSVLEGRGWISRTRSPEDRRTVYAGITDAGRHALEGVETLAIERASELLACLTEEENTQLHEGLSALYRVVLERLGTHYEDGSGPPPMSGCADGEGARE
ncbi:MAG: MarR family transcriptional regulator [Spirochaetes bacterium]|jgi:DNA-binding MarR family transcriptional regulator|nr:MarR family transcriptional regulator [Spirochaetota bacterium]